MKRIILLLIGLMCFSSCAFARSEYQSQKPFQKNTLKYSKNGFTTDKQFKQRTFYSGKPLQRQIINTNFKRVKSGDPKVLTTISNNIVSSNNIYFKQISAVERSIYGKSFDNQNVNARLNRLEYSVFNRTYPNMSYEQRVNNLIMNYNNSVMPKNISFSDIARLERRVLNRTFANETPQTRISRLEQQVFGAAQAGDISDRIGLLRDATKSYTTQTAAYPCYSPGVQMGRGWKGALGSLGNMMMYGGMPTGFTPQIDPNYMDYMDPGYQRGVTSNRGWGYNNYNSGSGSRVTILD